MTEERLAASEAVDRKVLKVQVLEEVCNRTGVACRDARFEWARLEESQELHAAANAIAEFLVGEPESSADAVLRVVEEQWLKPDAILAGAFNDFMIGRRKDNIAEFKLMFRTLVIDKIAAMARTAHAAARGQRDKSEALRMSITRELTDTAVPEGDDGAIAEIRGADAAPPEPS